MDHLEPGFDPNTLTVPRLRSVLVAHSVPYPSSAKKSQLIDIFNQHVAPQAGRLRSAQSHVTRTSNGIEDVASQTDTVDDEQPRRTTRARTEEGADTLRRVTRSRDTATPVEPVRRSTRVREDTAELYEAAEPRRSTRHRDEVTETPRRSRSKHARTTEGAETMEREAKRRASRASRLAAATPAAEESPFSRENVFQSGGSPPTATESRRRTTGRLSVRRKSRDDVVARRRTTDLRSTHEQHDGALVPTRETFDMTVPHGGAETESDTEVVQAAPRRRRTTSGTSTAPLAVLIALLLGLLTLWRQEKLQVGYCGVGQPSTDLAGVSIPPWAEFIRPQCEPCPAHAFCGEHLDTDCESDFVKRPHPLSLGGLIPLPPTCEPDGAKARRVQAVADRAISELREHTARYECGETPERALSEDQLKTILSSQRKKGMSREEFETLWNPALSEIRTSEEVVTSTNRYEHPHPPPSSPSSSNADSAAEGQANAASAPPASPESPSLAPSAKESARVLDTIFQDL
ncbi:hypothetical protein K470DRAFT_255480 [Piedraia hortae CBS 480.64]|uniref:LEM-like domain-containing protein n=1 Tax=Piedraia hortae CBS 480.64 TaxID=1314780 RepID=A0A6A7C6U7_9PEZI|nr:hypothetical protein K470DRAFT_255480 [Piedraia hortae CBS 480.64]